MKKITVILVFCLLLMVMVIPVNATESQGNTYTVQNATVKFEANSKFTAEEQRHIAEMLIYGNDEISTCGLSCFLFGHNYQTETITLVTHRARTTAPRCLEEEYEIRTCSKCGDTQKTLLSSGYINCCS